MSFIIPVRDDAQSLSRCLSSLQASFAAVPSETIVIDNGSTDGSAAVAGTFGARVMVLPHERVAAVRNAAAREARGTLLAFVDADHEVGPGWARSAVSLMTDPSVAAAGAQYSSPASGTWVQRMYDCLRPSAGEPREVRWLPSGNLVIRRSVFATLGGFDTSLETCEDVDLCRRLRSIGGRLIESSALRSVHHGDPTTLKALFFGELWRGRDNLRVSFRETLTLASLPGIGIPILNLAAIAGIALGVVAAGFGALQMALWGLVLTAVLALVRVAAMVRSSPPDLRSATFLIRALGFSLVYNAARSLALISRSGHAVRRKT